MKLAKKAKKCHRAPNRLPMAMYVYKDEYEGSTIFREDGLLRLNFTGSLMAVG
jgi:hypothetical protein